VSPCLTPPVIPTHGVKEENSHFTESATRAAPSDTSHNYVQNDSNFFNNFHEPDDGQTYMYAGIYFSIY
jgi:hypothetical protein